MTTRIDETNLVDYLRNFNRKRIRQSTHSNYRRKTRKIPLEEIINFLKKENPILIREQETNEFALTYYYSEKYVMYIIIALKGKYINIVTQYIFDNKRGKT